MARIAGVDLPRDKRLDIALRYIYGIGPTRAYEIVDGSGVEGGTKVRDLSEDEVLKIRAYIDQNLKVEGDLRREVAQDIKRKIEIGCYQGDPAPPVAPGPRPAHAHERAHPEGSEEDDRGPEEGAGQEVDEQQRERDRWRSPRRRRHGGGRRRTSSTARRTSSRRSTTRSSRSRTCRATRSRGRAPATWGSRAPASPRRSPRSSPPRRRARQAQEHGVQKVDVFVKGPGSGRETAIRSLAATGLEISGDPRRHAGSPQRVPASQAPPRLASGGPGTDGVSGTHHTTRGRNG